jgi:ATP-dependent DNA helicase DinG
MLTPHDILGQTGSIARRLEQYELRQEQLDMAEAVNNAFAANKHLAVEAGTGVGKSFAYLIPAILQTAGDQNNAETKFEPPEPDDEDPFCGEQPPNSIDPNRELQQLAASNRSDDKLAGKTAPPRAVISTHTISLQEQIIEKDIPFLRSVLPFEFTAVLVKGRSNYLCLRRLHSVHGNQKALFDDYKRQELQRMTDWSSKTDDGSKSGLNPIPDWEIWNEICCEAGNCMGKKCTHYTKCFYAAARRRIAHAQILVVNHALLFSDLAVRMQGGSILPVYNLLVFDEAHTMEQVAADHLGLSVTQGQVEYNLNRLYNPQKDRGLLKRSDVPREQLVAAMQAVEECFYASETFFHDLATWLRQRPGSNGRIREKGIVFNSFSGAVRKLSDKLRDVIDKIKNPEERTELRSAKDRIAVLGGDVDVWLMQSQDEESVYWLESTFTGRGRQRVSINASPIDIGPILREQLFNEIPSVVMTSATLATG